MQEEKLQAGQSQGSDGGTIDGVDSCMTVEFADTDMVLYQPTPAVTHPPCSQTPDLCEIEGRASVSSKCWGDLSSPEELYGLLGSLG